MQKKTGKKSNLSPEAVKILQKYRNAAKTTNSVNNGGADSVDESGAVKPSVPPPAQVRQRSGTRGK